MDPDAEGDEGPGREEAEQENQVRRLALLLLLLASCSGPPAPGRYQYVEVINEIYFVDTQAGRVWMLTSLDPETDGKAAATWKEIETPVTGKNRP